MDCLDRATGDLRARWRCETRNVSVAYGLDDTISIEKSYTVSGTTTWRTWRTGVRAHVQPMDTVIDTKAATPSTTTGYRIFVEEDLDVDHTCRVRGADGTIYTITGALAPTESANCRSSWPK